MPLATEGYPSATPFSRAAQRGVTALVLSLVLVSLAAGYISSWVPLVAGFPAGAIIRDALCGILIAGAIVSVVRQPNHRATGGPAMVAVVPFAVLAAWVVTLVVTSNSLTGAVLSARNLLLYPLVAVAVYVLWTHNLVRARWVMGGMLGVASMAAALGLADTLTGGVVVTALGFRRDFSGLPTGEGAIISGVSGAVAGIVRASGGVSDALVFGYLMAFVGVVALWVSTRIRVKGRREYRLVAACGFVAALAIAAMLASLTRGAWVAFAFGLAVLILMRPSRTVIATSILALMLAVASTTAMSGWMLSTARNAGTQPAGDLTGAVGDRVGSSDPASQLSSQRRLDQFETGIQVLAARPLGTGLASEGAAADRAGSTAVKSTPDIYLMIVALQTGIPGAVIWLSGLFVLLIWVARHRREGSAPIIAAGLTFFAVASILSHTPDAPPLSLFFWLVLLAIAPALSEEQGRAAAEDVNRDRMTAAASST
jgi:O-antigen ligase/polysaccharide polymerase Wzy-like membrane protein